MSATPIPRITMPAADAFRAHYLRTRTPVIITNLFEGDDIRQISTEQQAKEAFGHIRMMVQPEYVAGAGGVREAAQLMTMADYLTYIEQHPGTRLMCTEAEIPARLMAMFRLPEVCHAVDTHGSELLGLTRRWGDHDLLSNVFIANHGNCAHLHYDGDHRHVLLYQVFGRKEVILFPPGSGRHLRPLDSLVGFAGVSLESMTPAEKLELVHEAGGYYGTLEPGDAVYMPMLMWHYLEYTDTGMSFNIRFGRNRYGRFLCVDNFHRDYYIQNVASRFVDATETERAYQPCVDEIAAEYVRPDRSRREKVEDLRGLFKRLCTRICPEVEADSYCPPDREADEVDKILRDIEPSMRYLPRTPARLSGPITIVQRRQVTERVTRLGYPPAVLRKVLKNRLGKAEVETLTQVEAAQFLSYLTAPGAAW